MGKLAVQTTEDYWDFHTYYKKKTYDTTENLDFSSKLWLIFRF